jgi:hypothetical protein
MLPLLLGALNEEMLPLYCGNMIFYSPEIGVVDVLVNTVRFKQKQSN